MLVASIMLVLLVLDGTVMLYYIAEGQFDVGAASRTRAIAGDILGVAGTSALIVSALAVFRRRWRIVAWTVPTALALVTVAVLLVVLA